jgi:hypothetical protein
MKGGLPQSELAPLPTLQSEQAARRFSRDVGPSLVQGTM